MHTESKPEHNTMVSFAAAVLATVLTLGILAAVVAMFSSEGLPMEQLALAERACASHAYVSAREGCVREWLAAQEAKHLASR